MIFADVLEQENPAYAVDEATSKVVFDSGDGYTEHLERLTAEARLIYLVCRFESEIHSEGFLGYFTNSPADYCDELLEHLTVLGAANSHRMLRTAMNTFPGGVVPKTQAEREAMDFLYDNEELGETLGALDEEFYAYEDNLLERMNNYVRAHGDAQVRA